MNNKTIIVEHCDCEFGWPCPRCAERAENDSGESSAVILTHYELTQIFKHWAKWKIKQDYFFSRHKVCASGSDCPGYTFLNHRLLHLERIIGTEGAKRTYIEISLDIEDTLSSSLNREDWERMEWLAKRARKASQDICRATTAPDGQYLQ